MEGMNPYRYGPNRRFKSVQVRTGCTASYSEIRWTNEQMIFRSNLPLTKSYRFHTDFPR